LQSVTALISELFIVAGILSILVVQLPAAAFVAAGAAAAIMMSLLWTTQNRHVVWAALLHKQSVQLLQSSRQSLAAVKEAKILGRESYFVQRFAASRVAAARLDILRQTLESVPRLVVETAFVVALAMVILAAWLRPLGSVSLLSTLGIFAYGGLRLLPSLHLIVYRFNRIGSGKAAVDLISNDWHNLAPGVDSGAGSGDMPALAGDIVFDRVSFSYEGAAALALNDISLVIQRGESVGIVGPTGAGKSTLIDLMLGLLEPSSGAIRVDGVNIHSGLRAWQSQIGYVPQSIYLTDDTIRRNIALGVDDAEIDEAQVREAAGAAQLEGFLASLPDGLDTLTGERGVKLSGGERQRIAVARALYRRPSILIFDEATAALDNATERELTATVQGLHGRATLIFIAHRLTTVEACDRLILLRNGAIADSGSYEDLVARHQLVAP
jgi:ATP-binding cassette subfamily C protein